MELTKQVVSLELAQKLKELGVKQESLFCWEDDSDAVYLITRAEANREGKEWSESCPSAFTVAELGELIPHQFPYTKEHISGYNYIVYKPRATHHEVRMTSDVGDTHIVQADTEADARAKMLIYLLESKLK